MDAKGRKKYNAVFVFLLVISLAVGAIGIAGATGNIPNLATTVNTVTFGNTVVGSFQNTMSANMKGGSGFAATASGTLTDIYAYMEYQSTAGNAQAALYADSSGLPGALLATSNQVALPSSFTWVHFSFSSPPSETQGARYWLVILRNVNAYIMADNTINNDIYNSNPWSSGFSNPFGTPATTYITVELSIYGVIQPQSSTTPTPTPAAGNYLITFSCAPSDGGTVTITNSVGTAWSVPATYQTPQGSSLTLNEVPMAHYVFSHWEIDGFSQGSTSYTFIPTKDTTIVAVFMNPNATPTPTPTPTSTGIIPPSNSPIYPILAFAGIMTAIISSVGLVQVNKKP